jgi:energy-coupling factor transport system ATP-binding protein
MQIEVKNLSFTYSKDSKVLSLKALDDINLTIYEGDFFGIIGQTGSGKTTFVQHLNGLIRLQKNAGEIKLSEVEFGGDGITQKVKFDLADKKCDFKALRAKVGMVFQYPEHQLFAETVFEDVAFGLKNFEPDLSDEEVEQKVREALEIVGLDYQKVREKSPFELSGGQKRRVAIAGVIVTRPEVLVLDEPAAGLDPIGKRDFIALLHKLHNTFVKTIILVSHDMNLVSENCNRAGIFSYGKLVEVGTPKEIFANYEKIQELGLSLPTTAYLMREMNARGIKIDCDLTVKDFVRAVTERGKE